MKEIVTMVKGYVDDLAHLMMSFIAIGAVSEVIFGTGIFGVNVIGNLTTIINNFGFVPQQTNCLTDRRLDLTIDGQARGRKTILGRGEQNLGIHHGFHFQDIAIGVLHKERFLLEFGADETAVWCIEVVDVGSFNTLL